MLAQVVMLAPSLQLGKMAAGRLFKILDRKPRIYSPSSCKSTWVSYSFKINTHMNKDLYKLVCLNKIKILRAFLYRTVQLHYCDRRKKNKGGWLVM